MKKFRILGIIAIIAILANFIGGLDEDWKDFKKGFEEGQSGATEMYESGHHMITRVKLNVKPLSGTTVDSLNNNRVDSPLPYTITEIETYAKPSAWYILVIGLAIPGLFFFLIGFYSLIRLLISISRREVFIPANVLRLRWFAYTSASLKILTTIGEWLTGNAAMNQISIPGYKIISYVGYSPDWVAIILPILFADIFAIGLKIKEQQHLTIKKIKVMKEKNTLPSKGKSIFYLMLSLIATLFVSSFIYFLVLHPSLDNKAVRISINIGWTCFCLYAFKRLTQRYTFWWHALDENPNKSQNN